MPNKVVEYSIDLDKVDVSNIEHLVRLHCEGMSFREISLRYGIPASTAYSKVKKVVGYKSYNLAKIIRKDYLESAKFSKKHRESIKQWLAKNSVRLHQINGVFMSYQQEQNLAIKETSGAGDWIDAIDNGSVVRPKYNVSGLY